MIYFDNAATTFHKPRQVTQKTLAFIRRGYGNAGRGGHRVSLESAECIYEARETIARFLNFHNPNGVVFSQNATQALNVAIKTCIPKGANVLTSYLEHNSVLRPLYSLEAIGEISISFFSHQGDIEKNIEELLRPNTVIVSTLVSNVTGEKIPLEILAKIRKRHGVFIIVDGSQFFCHRKIDLAINEVDVFCSAGHKGAMGMQGVAFSIYKESPKKTYFEGGSGVETFSQAMPNTLPERLEAGTLSAPAIASLKYGIEYIEKYGIDRIEKRLELFDSYLDEQLEALPNVRLLSRGDFGIHSFLIRKQSASTTAKYLEKYNIMVRSGYHCAPLIHKLYKTEETGAVRVSFSFLNKLSEIKYLIYVLKKIKA